MESAEVIYLLSVCSTLRIVLIFGCLVVLPLIVFVYAINGSSEYEDEKKQEYANKIRWLVKLWIALLLLIIFIPNSETIQQIFGN